MVDEIDNKDKEKSIKESVHVRISKKLSDYIKYIQSRFEEEYGMNVPFTEASNLLVQRAKGIFIVIFC